METREESKIMAIIYRISLVALIISVTLIAYIISIAIIVYREGMEYRDYLESDRTAIIEYSQNNIGEISQDLSEPTKDEIRDMLRDMYKPDIYFEWEAELGSRAGLTNIVLRTVRTQKGLDNLNYCHTLAHEYVHLTKMIINERLTEYITLTTLCESEYPYFQYVGNIFLLAQFTIFEDENYNCRAQLIDYYKQKGVI